MKLMSPCRYSATSFERCSRDAREAQHLEARLEHVRRRGRELDELEAHQSHRIVEEISHACSCVRRDVVAE